MRVLFDKSAPYGLVRHLAEHVVSTAEERGWGRLENGALLTVAEEAGFEVFLTADKTATPGSYIEVDIPLPPKKPLLGS